jgi:hypothetical protein
VMGWMGWAGFILRLYSVLAEAKKGVLYVCACARVRACVPVLSVSVYLQYAAERTSVCASVVLLEQDGIR